MGEKLWLHQHRIWFGGSSACRADDLRDFQKEFAGHHFSENKEAANIRANTSCQISGSFWELIKANTVFCVSSLEKKKLVENRREESSSHLTFNGEMNKDKDRRNVLCSQWRKNKQSTSHLNLGIQHVTDVALRRPITGGLAHTEPAKLSRVGRDTRVTCPPVWAWRGQMDRRCWSGAGVGPASSVSVHPLHPWLPLNSAGRPVSQPMEGTHTVMTPALGSDMAVFI